MPHLFYSRKIKEKYQTALTKAHALYGDPICGTTRATFSLPCNTKVLKVPYTNSGEEQNRSEARYFGPTPLADCTLIEDDNGVALLEMERVTPIYPREKGPALPRWVWSIDCEQVGYTADGRLVAYDL